MPRFVVRITEELLASIGEAIGESAENLFGDKKFALITFLADTEMNLKFMTEDELFVEVKNDSSIQIVM
jgi:hypothetical protein